MRAFIALPLPDDVADHIADSLIPLQKEFPEIKWLKKNAFHITIQFLGDIDEKEVISCTELLHNPALTRGRIAASYGGVGQFPPKGRPRVFYSMIYRGFEACIAVYQDVAALLPSSIKTDTKPFSPHITLGRVKRGMKPPSRTQVQSCLQDMKGEFLLDRLVLFESIRKPAGAEYREVAETRFR